MSASTIFMVFGFMIYSGSVLLNSGDNYICWFRIIEKWFLKFRTNPSVFEVRQTFFVGKQQHNS